MKLGITMEYGQPKFPCLICLYLQFWTHTNAYQRISDEYHDMLFWIDPNPWSQNLHPAQSIPHALPLLRQYPAPIVSTKTNTHAPLPPYFTSTSKHRPKDHRQLPGYVILKWSQIHHLVGTTQPWFAQCSYQPTPPSNPASKPSTKIITPLSIPNSWSLLIFTLTPSFFPYR